MLSVKSVVNFIQVQVTIQCFSNNKAIGSHKNIGRLFLGQTEKYYLCISKNNKTD